MLPENVKKGDMVTCINAVFYEDLRSPFRLQDLQLPKKNEIYTVRCIEYSFSGGVGVRLEEIINKEYRDIFGRPKEIIFSLRRFELV
jgi:hypothetical protein